MKTKNILLAKLPEGAPVAFVTAFRKQLKNFVRKNYGEATAKRVIVIAGDIQLSTVNMEM